jgi:hypothetical protein
VRNWFRLEEIAVGRQLNKGHIVTGSWYHFAGRVIDDGLRVAYGVVNITRLAPTCRRVPCVTAESYGCWECVERCFDSANQLRMRFVIFFAIHIFREFI